MTAKKKKKKQIRFGSNLAINLALIVIFFSFIGYLLGEYGYTQRIRQQQLEKRQVAQGESVPVFTTQSSIPTRSSEPASPVPTPPPQSPSSVRSEEPVSLFRVQVGVFSEKSNAERQVLLLKEAGYEAIIVGAAPYRVQTGAFGAQENARKLMEDLQKKGFEAIIVR